MKRTSQMIFLIFLEILLSVILKFLFISKIYLIIFFIVTTFLLFVLISEPYWKIGGILIYFMIVEVYLYFLNLSIFNLLLDYHGIFNLIVLVLGFFIVVIAHNMKLKELNNNNSDYNFDEDEKLPEFTDVKSDEENVDLENNDSEQEKLEQKIFVATKSNIIHSEDCGLIKKVNETRLIGSLKYAKSEKFKPCKICKPFQ